MPFLPSRELQRVALFFFAQISALFSASAHETWLAPSAFQTEPGQPLTISLTSGMNFPQLEYALRPERVASAKSRQNEKNSSLPLPQSGKDALLFRPVFNAPGLAAIWLTLHPKTLELSEEKVAEYFEEIEAPAEIRAQWARLKATYKWRETYTKCAKTFLLVGEKIADEASWKNALGLPLEIIPLSDPTRLHRGEILAVQLQENGKPCAAMPVGCIVAGEKRTFQITDAEGRASFMLPREGAALFFAVRLVWREPEWHSLFTTMCVNISP